MRERPFMEKVVVSGGQGEGLPAGGGGVGG